MLIYTYKNNICILRSDETYLSRPKSPCAPRPLFRRRPTSLHHDETLHPNASVKRPQLHVAAIHDEAHPGDSYRGLGDVGCHDDLTYAPRGSLEYLRGRG